MSAKNFISNRLDKQIHWYDSKSKANKKRYYFNSLLCIALSSLIPILVFLKFILSASDIIYDVIIGLCGILLLVLFCLSLLFDYRDKWNHYREVAEKLKAEKSLYANKSGIYLDAKQPDTLLIERVESLISPRHS